MQDERHRNARGDILRYAGGNVHDGDGALHPFLREVGGESRLLSFMSMMAGKKVGKETAVLIYDSIHKNKVLVMEAIRQNGKIILHSNDGTSMKMIFKKTEFLFEKE